MEREDPGLVAITAIHGDGVSQPAHVSVVGTMMGKVDVVVNVSEAGVWIEVK